MYTLSNNTNIPKIGFGTYKTTKEAMLSAMEVGYRYFDTASFYDNEDLLGRAVKESGIERSNLFIATKVWKEEMGYNETKFALKRSLEKLEMDYVDLYIIHWPKPTPDYTRWKELCIETWKALEELYKENKTRAIGLSNFLPHHIEVILKDCEIKPMTNQLEIHPGYSQESAISYCKENNISLQAWSPLGRQRMLNHPLLENLSEKYNVTSAQICLRYLVERNIIPIPKASTKERMEENLDVFSFTIEKDDMYRLMTIPQAGWSGEHPDYPQELLPLYLLRIVSPFESKLMD